MIKNRKLIVILTVLMLSIALLPGCGSKKGGETTQKDKIINQELENKVPPETETETKTETENRSKATANGTLKAVDAAAGTVTVTAENGDELVFKVTKDSKIIQGVSPATIAQLSDKTDLKVRVEYYDETMEVISVRLEDKDTSDS